MSDLQNTLILLKPDAVERKVVGRIISRLEDKGLSIIEMRMLMVTEELAREHYAEHAGKPFVDGLVEFITSGPVVAMVLRGPHAVEVCRTLMGDYGPGATPGTIRGDFSILARYNLVHGSDSPESAAREIELFFGAS
jgi:nucleoside-diphosphate kinase